MSYEQVVWSWVQHLRTGGTTTWQDWVAHGQARTDGDDPAPPGWTVPGAAELEFVRRASSQAAPVNPDPAVMAELSDVVLSRSGPGRGLGQLPLSGVPGSSRQAFGTPSVDPADVPRHELVRVGVGVLTELLLRAAPPPPDEGPRRRRLCTRPFRLVGAPVTAAAVRRLLAQSGQSEGGRSPRVVVVAEPLDVALAQAWSARVQRGAAVRWPGFVERWSVRDELPPSADYPALARFWAERVGTSEVHVVAAPGSRASATRTTASVLGVTLREDRLPDHGTNSQCEDLSPEAVDVIRRVNAVLHVRADDRQHRMATRMLAGLLAGGASGDVESDRFTVPSGRQQWVSGRARQVTEDLRSGGYPVHGELRRLVPRSGARTRPRLDDVLALVTETCLGLASLQVSLRRAEP